LLPDDPAEVDYTIPDVPEGLESLVADLRDEIEEGADALADLLDFNQFAFDFVCEEICDEFEVVIGQANE
jgi:hypothetical protein